ncbi:methyl-accepting chemotaxis protein [Mobilisporobacter senegalensis]|uniref:Methyl-accepting chemotaxis protein n=1 Tax=Mobilisporobacter senegalensis TaxID=1329262 RepID=A0A3N1XNG2_9FIRM|nr:methyl-accepting chemotaxis protein [Mobilisporobacter senegalensis]ROR28233.1 methyl-accepting chemotaxis protein [Mobilisporobacter senegalensis]
MKKKLLSRKIHKERIINKRKRSYIFDSMGSIRVKLIGAFIIPVGLIIVLGVVSYSKASSGLIRNYELATISTINSLTEYLDFGFSTVESKANMLNSNSTLMKYYSGYYRDNKVEELKQYEYVKSLIASNIWTETYISNIYLFSKYGRAFGVSADGAEGEALYDNYMESKDGLSFIESGEKTTWVGRHSFIDEHVSNGKDYSISHMSYLYNSSGRPIGFIVIDVNNDYIEKVLDNSGMLDKGSVAFITSDGKEIVGGKQLKDYKLSEQDYFMKAINSDDKQGYSYINIGDKEYMFSYSKTSKGNALLCALIPKAEIIKEAKEMKEVTLIIVFLASIIAIICGTIIASGIGNVINKTNQVLNVTAQGNLGVRVEMKRKDEFAILARSINHMIESMMGLIQKVTVISATVSHSAFDVSGSSQVLLDATKKINESLLDIEQGIMLQAEDSSNCLAEMSTLSKQINEIYLNTSAIGDSAKETKSVVRHGFTIISELEQKAKNTTKITREVIRNIEDLEKESDSIGEIVQTINAIAEETNLLALNASIEAARAGEFGKGFSVVADEIRKLSNQSTTAANQIDNIIIGIHQKTIKTVGVAKEAEGIVASQSDALGHTIALFSEINEHVEELTRNLIKISERMVEIEHAKEDTLGAIENISSVSQETASASNELAGITTEQLRAVETLTAAAAKLDEDAKDLDESVAIFKI